MIKKILLLLVVAITVVCVLAARKPDEMNVTRSATIAAPPEAVFKVVNDFRQWDAWSPWSKLDPNMTKSLEGPPEGEGAVYKWSGNMEVGEGSTKLVESKPSEKIGMKLTFVRPMEGTSDVIFTFVPEGAGTRVTWNMRAPQPFIGKVMSVFIDCEKMCGDSFNEGLANLKKIAESAPKA